MPASQSPVSPACHPVHPQRGSAQPQDRPLTSVLRSNVQVTLGILTALIEKSPKDLPLFATNVLKILDQILRSKDITMVESSLSTFEAFCENHDPSSLLADQAYVRQYEAIVRSYATLASTRQGSKPVEMRWRNAGLEAIKSVASSDALSSVAGRQFHVIVPMILENLWTDNDDFLEVLLQRTQMEEKIDAERLLRRRTSIATVRTVDTAGDTNPIALSGTAFDVDKLAEEDIGVLAMQCLKQIFVVPNRNQIHSATLALMRFVEERVKQDEPVVKTNPNTGKDSGWAIKMLDFVARWTPVQDRYIIITTTMDMLVQRPVEEENLPLHLALTATIGSLLRSDVNMIGLSVMDILLGFIQHMKKVLQLPGAFSQGQEGPEERSPSATEAANIMATQCKELLGRLQQDIGDLATHVYYADQISDMISTILVRLKPGRSSSANSSPQGEKAEGAGAGAGTGTSIVDLAEPQMDAYVSANAGRTAALKAIKAILLVANPKTKVTGNMSLSRNRVPIQVWEGTQWLLRDPDGQVRKAYVDALTTWLDRETTRADLKARDENISTLRSSMKNSKELPPVTAARRAASSASNRGDKPPKVPRSHFLQMIHLAIYDNALQFVDFETDIVLLHVLLAKLVFQLGVNSVRYGLPMVFRLQEDIQEVDAPIQKVRIGSLCHGYFWVLTDKFDFEASLVGRAIHNEIVRRRSKNFWVEGVNIPTPMLELVGTPGLARPQPKMPIREIESEALLPFDDRISLVECVAISYQETSASPPTSPAASPGRTFSHPVMGSAQNTAPADHDPELPSHFRELMLMDWSRETVLLALQAGSKSESLNGSKAGTTGTNRNRLAVNGGANGHSLPGPTSPYGSQHNLRPGSSNAQGGLAPLSKLRKSSVRSGVSPSPSASSRGYVASVEQLKMVLSGHLSGANFESATVPKDDDTGSGSDSMVSYEFTPSELSFAQPTQPELGDSFLTTQRTMSGKDRKDTLGPLNSNPPNESGPIIQKEDGEEKAEDVPPVPPLPSLTALTSKGGEMAVHELSQSTATHDHAVKPAKRNIHSRGGESNAGAFREENAAAALDLHELLKGIDSRAGEGSLGGVTKPPY
jgi:protein EFR3